MTLFLLLLCLACSLGLLRHWHKSHRWSHLPGAPWYLSLPLIGHGYLASFGNIADPRGYLRKMVQRYGSLFRFDLGHVPTIFLSDYDDIVASSNTEELLGKPFDNLSPIIDIKGQDADGELGGIFFCKGQTWKELRKFTVRHLSDLGMGKKDTMEAIVLQIPVHHLFSVAVNNVIWRLVTGHRTGQNDQETNCLTKSVNEMLAGLDFSHPLTILQTNSRLVCSAMRLLCLKTLPDYARPLKEMVTRFLAQIEKARGDTTSVFHNKKGHLQLLGTAIDLFVAGTDTTTTQLEWCVMYLVMYPDMQERFTPEHCTNAPHYTHQDVMFREHYFPAGTQVLHWHDGVHFDPQYFESPEEFRGDRFLDKAGNFTGRDKHVLAFSTGKRRCVGEKLARAELYIFLCSLVQAFEVSLPSGEKASMEWGRMVLPYPRPFTVVLTPRRP